MICVAAAVTALAAACSDGHSTVPTAAAEGCALIVKFQGTTYRASHARAAPVPGDPVGTGVIPACDDHGPGSPSSDQRVQLARLRGVPPNVALIWIGHPETVLVREGVDVRAADLQGLS